MSYELRIPNSEFSNLVNLFYVTEIVSCLANPNMKILKGSIRLKDCMGAHSAFQATVTLAFKNAASFSFKIYNEHLLILDSGEPIELKTIAESVLESCIVNIETVKVPVEEMLTRITTSSYDPLRNLPRLGTYPDAVPYGREIPPYEITCTSSQVNASLSKQ